MEIESKRIGNLSFSKASYLCKVPENPAYHINYHYPNSYYGKEKEFIKFDNEFYVYPDSPTTGNYFKVHKSVFKNPECQLAIAAFRYDNSSNSYNLEYVNDRPLTYINNKNFEDFQELLKYGFKQLNPIWYEDD